MTHSPIRLTRVHVFVDFWNLLLANGPAQGPPGGRPKWDELGPWLAARAAKVLQGPRAFVFDHMHVYVSHDAGSSKDDGLRRFAEHHLGNLPDVTVNLRARVRRRAPACPGCSSRLGRSPCCGISMSGTQEKGVDTAIAADMLDLAWRGLWDVAVLVSNDADFVPVVEVLARHGMPVVHAQTGTKGARLVEACTAAFAADVGMPLAQVA